MGEFLGLGLGVLGECLEIKVLIALCFFVIFVRGCDAFRWWINYEFGCDLRRKGKLLHGLH